VSALALLPALALAVLGTAWAVARSFAPWLQVVVALVAVASLSLALARRRGSAKREREPARGAWLLALAAAAAAALFAVETARNPEGGWDAWGHWNRMARALVRAPAQSPLPFSAELAAAHPDYPLLLPGAVAAGWDLAGREGWLWPAAVAALFALMLAAALHQGLGASRHVATALLVGVPCFPALTANQYADGPLAALWALGAVQGIRAMELARDGAPSRAPWLASGFCLAMAAWTKNEGALLLGLLPLFLALELPRGTRLASAASFLAGAAAPLTVLVGFKATLAPKNDLLEAVGLETLARLAEPARWLELARETGLHLVRFKDWGLTLPAVLVAAIWLWRWGKSDPGCRVLARAVAGVLVAYALILTTTPLDPGFHLKTALGRLLFQVWPLLLLWSGRAWEARSAASASATPSGPPSPS
jgi:hypothetical protein